MCQLRSTSERIHRMPESVTLITSLLIYSHHKKWDKKKEEFDIIFPVSFGWSSGEPGPP